MCVVTALGAHALELSPPHRVLSEENGPLAVSAYSRTTVASDDGYLVIWVDGTGLWAVRVDKGRRVVDAQPMLLARWDRSAFARHLTIDAALTDGRTFLVSWSEATHYAGWHYTHRVTTVSWEGAVVTSEPRPGRWLGAARSGARAVALLAEEVPGVRNPTPFVIAADFAGNVLARASCGFCSGPAVSKRMVVDGGRVWLLGSRWEPRTEFYRIPLATESGEPAPGEPEALVDGSVWSVLEAAGVAGERWYLVTRGGITAGKVRVRFLSRTDMRPVSGWIDLGERETESATATAIAGGELAVAFAGREPAESGRRLSVFRVAAAGGVEETFVAGVQSLEPPEIGLFRDRTGVVLFHHLQWGPIVMNHLRVRGGGRLLVRPPVAVSRGTPRQDDLRGARVGSGFVAVWQQWGISESEIYAAPLTLDGAPAGPSQFLMHGQRPRIASNGDVALVVALTPGGYRFLRVGGDARPLEHTPVALTDVVPQGAGFDLVWDGSAFAMAFEDYRQPITALRIGAGGERLGAAVALTPPPASGVAHVAPALEVSPRALLLVWSAVSSAGRADGTTVYARGFTHDLVALSEPLALAPADVAPRVVWREREFVAAWEEDGLTQLRRIDEAVRTLSAPDWLGFDLPDDFELFTFGGALVAGTARAVVRLPDGASWVLANPSGTGASFVPTGDGRMLMLYTTGESVAGYVRYQAWARTIAP